MTVSNEGNVCRLLCSWENRSMELDLSRWKHFTAMAIIGDGVMGMIHPTRSAKAWHYGPQPWQNLMQSLEDNPNLTRAISALQVVGGILWESRRCRWLAGFFGCCIRARKMRRRRRWRRVLGGLLSGGAACDLKLCRQVQVLRLRGCAASFRMTNFGWCVVDGREANPVHFASLGSG